MQVGRSYLKILIKKYVSFFNCCGESEKKNSDFYYLQNNDEEKFGNKLTVKTENETTDEKENENKLVDIKEEKKDINFMKAKINLMDDNDLEGLLLTTPVESNLITNKENNAQQLIDEDNKKDIDSSIIINDNENDN